MVRKKCSWCKRKFTYFLLEDVTVTAESEGVTETKHVKLCVECMVKTLTMRGLMLSRTVPSEIMEDENGQEG